MQLNSVHNLRNTLNRGIISRKHLRKYPPEIIVATIKMYLQELPVSLCSDDIYDALKLLYLSSKGFNIETEDQTTMRLNSIRSLLATMPSCHLATLHYFMKYWHDLLKHSPNHGDKVSSLALLLGPILLRPKTESSVTLHDKHPVRLCRDLLMHCDEILSASFLTPNGSQDELNEDDDLLSDDESFDDDEASTRGIYLGNHNVSNSSLSNASFVSHFTRKTGTSLTIPYSESEASFSDVDSVKSKQTMNMNWMQDSIRNIFHRATDRHVTIIDEEAKEKEADPKSP